MNSKYTIALWLAILATASSATMISDDAKWRRGMFSAAETTKTTTQPAAMGKEGATPTKEAAKPGEGTTTEPALVDGELRFRVDPDYGYVEYRLPDQEVMLYGGAFAEYDQNTIKADVIRYRVDDKVVWAEGRAILTDPQQSVIGRRMSYDLNTKQGLVYSGDSQASIGYYTGEKVKWVSQKTLYAKNGTFTTCDREEPDYNFWSPRLKIMIDDQVVAQPAIMHISRVPVMALPYYYMSLRRDRHSGFLAPYARYVSGQYFTVNNGYFWAINDYCDLTARLNYFSKRGWQEQGYFVYLYGSKTSINSFDLEHMWDRSSDSEWWSVNWYHRQDITDRTTFLGQLVARNNVNYDRRFGEDFKSRTANNLNSFAALTHRLDDYNFLCELRRTQEIDVVNTASTGSLATHQAVTTTSSLPHASISGTTQQIDDTAIYYSLHSDFMNYYRKDQSSPRELNVYRRATAGGNLTRPFRFFGWLNYAPTGSYTEQWEMHNINGTNNYFFGQYNVSNTVNTKAYGIFPLSGDRVLRHIISPSITHSYSPRANTSWMYQGYVTGLGSNYLNMSLGNSLDLRLPETENNKSGANQSSDVSTGNSKKSPVNSSDSSGYGSSGDSTSSTTSSTGDNSSGLVESGKSKYYGGTRIDLVTLSTSIGYNFWPITHSNVNVPISVQDPPLPQLTTRNWSNLYHSLRISPNFAQWYNFSTQLTLNEDPYKQFKTTSLSLVTSLGFTTAGLARQPDQESTSDNTSSSTSQNQSQNQNLNRYDPSEATALLSRLRAGEGMGQGFVVQLDHEYTPGLTSNNDIHTLRGEIGFNLSNSWRIRYDNYYDLHNGEVISEHYRIYRDLHCWEAEVRISTERKQVEYWFQIRIKELPEFQLFGTREREY